MSSKDRDGDSCEPSGEAAVKARLRCRGLNDIESLPP